MLFTSRSQRRWFDPSLGTRCRGIDWPYPLRAGCGQVTSSMVTREFDDASADLDLGLHVHHRQTTRFR